MNSFTVRSTQIDACPRRSYLPTHYRPEGLPCRCYTRSGVKLSKAVLAYADDSATLQRIKRRTIVAEARNLGLYEALSEADRATARELLDEWRTH